MKPMLVMVGGMPVGILMIGQRDVDLWDWSWERADGSIVLGTEASESDAALAARKAMVGFYEGMN